MRKKKTKGDPRKKKDFKIGSPKIKKKNMGSR